MKKQQQKYNEKKYFDIRGYFLTRIETLKHNGKSISLTIVNISTLQDTERRQDVLVFLHKFLFPQFIFHTNKSNSLTNQLTLFLPIIWKSNYIVTHVCTVYNSQHLETIIGFTTQTVMLNLKI